MRPQTFILFHFILLQHLFFVASLQKFKVEVTQLPYEVYGWRGCACRYDCSRFLVMLSQWCCYLVINHCACVRVHSLLKCWTRWVMLRVVWLDYCNSTTTKATPTTLLSTSGHTAACCCSLPDFTFTLWGVLMWEIGRRLGHYGDHPHPQVADRGTPLTVTRG